MKHNLSDLAIFGGSPAFSQPLPVGQLCIPDKARFERAFCDILQRRYYTNHGPLEAELERRLEDFFQVEHVITVTNGTIGLLLACKALDLPKGSKVVVPAFTFAATVQALTWTGLEPVFCDVDPETHSLSVAHVQSLAREHELRAILGVHLWGIPCQVDALAALAAEEGIPLFYDAAHAVGNTHRQKHIGNFGALEVFSFHATKILSSGEGGCITTNDGHLAEVLRNMRSSYGRRRELSLPLGANGRFSEAQAAMGLMGLEDFAANCAANHTRLAHYRERLEGLPGLRFLLPPQGEFNNCQYVILEIDAERFGLTRDQIVTVLGAELILCRRYFTPGVHRCPPYRERFPQFVEALPQTDRLCARVMQLPSGNRIDQPQRDAIADMLLFLHTHAEEIAAQLEVRNADRGERTGA